MFAFIHFVKKETYHIFRDKRTLLILFGMPVVMIILFGYAIRNDIGRSDLAVVDEAHDAYSAKLIAEINASAYFDVVKVLPNEASIDNSFRKEEEKIVLIIPPHFGQHLFQPQTGKAQVRIVADASDPNLATSLTNYATAIINTFQGHISTISQPPLAIIQDVRMLYNPEMKSVYEFVPGLMALILMLVSAMMTAITITREKETGTMEVLLASPLPPALIILGKITPYILLSFINALLILGFGNFLFHVPVHGSLILLLAESVLFILTALSLGILISTVAVNQQTAMMISLGGLLMPTVVLSGFIFPLSSMPVALQWLANFIPAKWFIIILRDIMLKGNGWGYVWKETMVLLIMTLFFILLSIKRFKIRLS
ncbi:MAG: ABC transporter permease [Chitinophagaceae bacterium]|nr:MAG: ABC transporter permease [Chitinophagaceae bacterium]